MILTVLEHQKILIGKCRDAARPQISQEDAQLLRILDMDNRGLFRWGNGYLTTKQWVGAIALPGLSVEILPKVTESYDEDFTRSALLYMFRIANHIPTKERIPAKVSFIRNGLVEILIANFLDCVEHYFQEGFYASYTKVTRDLPTVKGSIDFSKQMSRNLLNPTRFVCRYSRMETDNPVNRQLKYVLRTMQRVSCEYSNRKRIAAALRCFEGVADLDAARARDGGIQVTKANQRMQLLLRYAFLFLDGYAVSINSGKHKVSSMLFDMNVVFEKFLYRSCRKLYGADVQYQNRKHYLITSKSSAAKRICLKPDLLISVPGRPRLVVDTKWKRIRRFVKESDVYQMNAYISAIDGVDTALLLYPMADGAAGAVGDYEFTNSAGKKELRIRAVDLSLVEDEPRFLAHIESLLV